MTIRSKRPTSLNINIITHPLAQHKLTYLRDRECSTNRFRQITREIGSLLAFEALRNRTSNLAKITTPLFPNETFEAFPLAEKIVVVAILRAGLVLAEGALDIVPNAYGGHIALKRRPNEYNVLDCDLVALPVSDGRFFIMMDTVIGTGATACAALDILTGRGVPQEMICFAAIVAAPQGVAHIEKRFPKVNLCTVAIDLGVDERNHVMPGLGDTAERMFGSLRAKQ